VSNGAGPGFSVELAGIPGSGKSRRVRALAAALSARGVLVHQPQSLVAPSTPTGLRLARKAVACGAVALGAPARTARIVRGVARSGQPGAADVAGRSVQWLLAQRITDGARLREGVSIVDEGLVQAVWSTALRGDMDTVLRAVASTRPVPTPDMVVVVRVPPELALARLTDRASRHSRTQLLPEAEGLAELERGAQLLDQLVEWWSSEALTPAGVVSLSGAHDSVADRDLLVDRICASIDASGPSTSVEDDLPT
jgi:hypothetical protein